MDNNPTLPVPISLVNDKYLVFDIDAVSYLRRAYRICGVMTGTLPQNPSQNVFLGLPVQIMPEEAQLLIEKGVGYLIDDSCTHDQTIRAYDSVRHADYMASVRYKAEQASKIRTGLKEEQRKVALSKQKTNKQQPQAISSPQPNLSSASQNHSSRDIVEQDISALSVVEPNVNKEDTLFESSPQPNIKRSSQTRPATNQEPSQDQLLPLITPTTSAPLVPSIPSRSRQQVLNLPKSYPLYRHLNSKSYFTTPGLRFGCQYCVYPGDPLRFHSHFLATSYEWEEEIDLMDIVGGGRLGTGVKKGFLIGGAEKSNSTEGDSQSQGKVRTYSVEWAAM